MGGLPLTFSTSAAVVHCSTVLRCQTVYSEGVGTSHTLPQRTGQRGQSRAAAASNQRPRWEDLGSAGQPHPVSLRLKGDLLGVIGNPRQWPSVPAVVGQMSPCAAYAAPELG